MRLGLFVHFTRTQTFTWSGALAKDLPATDLCLHLRVTVPNPVFELQACSFFVYTACNFKDNFGCLCLRGEELEQPPRLQLTHGEWHVSSRKGLQWRMCIREKKRIAPALNHQVCKVWRMWTSGAFCRVLAWSPSHRLWAPHHWLNSSSWWIVLKIVLKIIIIYIL